MKDNVLTSDSVTLAPIYTIPIVIILNGIALSLWQVIGGVILTLFGIFLLIQTFIIRLTFTSTCLEVYRSGKLIRSFPYIEWQNWAIFWQPVPILFYFKEVKSIHFLPIIFDPITLKECLIKYCPQQ